MIPKAIKPVKEEVVGGPGRDVEEGHGVGAPAELGLAKEKEEFAFKSTLNEKFEPLVRGHLKNVYGSLALCMLSASAGTYIPMVTNILATYIPMFNNIYSGAIMFLLGLGLASIPLRMRLWFTSRGELGLALIPDAHDRTPLRMMLWFTSLYGFITGVFEPLDMDMTFVRASIIYACFSGAALFAPDKKYLYLGGSVLSGLITLIFLNFLNMFFGCQLLFQGHIYSVLAIFCMVIMFYTEPIILKARRGNTDFITQALDLWHIVFLLLVIINGVCKLVSSVA